MSSSWRHGQLCSSTLHLSPFMLASIRAAFNPPAPDEGLQQRPPRYAGEDTSPTSHRELLGWYAYGIAAEVFAVCGVGTLTAILVISQSAQVILSCIRSTNRSSQDPFCP